MVKFPQTHAMTVDVEDYFQVQLYTDFYPRTAWEELPRRVEANVDRLLFRLAEAPAKATFFVLGWLAERHPAMVRRIHDAGHEIASHGYDHRRADQQTPEAFQQDALRTRLLLETVIDAPVIGYRAASYSIGASNRWALASLRQAGYHYSSSVYPIRHDLYGWPQAPITPFRPHPEGVMELPVAALPWLGLRLPAGGGGYFRLYPYRLSRWLLHRFGTLSGGPGIFFIHPWEIDPGQPRPPGLPLRTRLRHHLNLTRTEDRLTTLLREFTWDRVDRLFAEAITRKQP